MKCTGCGAADLVPGTRDTRHLYKDKGGPTNLPAVNGDFCAVCGKAVQGAIEFPQSAA